MCGIIGIINSSSHHNVELGLGMLNRVYHRGPDEGFIWAEDNIVMGTRRLAIINLQYGIQPVFSEDGQIAAVFNGEIYNHLEIKKELQASGYVIRDGSDAEIIPHAYRQWGMDFPTRLNGQFAIAIWDRSCDQLVLARDRIGIKPLFYTTAENGDFLFASEMKSLFTHPWVAGAFDIFSIAQIFSFWTVVDSFTPFKGVKQVPCGTIMGFAADGTPLETRRYWDVPASRGNYRFDDNFEECAEAFRGELRKSVSLRLRADVKVGTYTSGGIDSSIINYITYKELRHRDMETFSVGFDDSFYDESVYQTQLTRYLELEQNTAHCRNEDIYSFFPDMIYHIETPVFRTAPVPMFLLSKKVQEKGLKVVLTGEGSDEITWGYDVFRETMVRRFWGRQPDSKIRPQLFRKMYGYLPQFQNPRYFNLALDFFRRGMTDFADPFYSHALRITNSMATHVYFNEQVKKQISQTPLQFLEASLPDDYCDRTPLEKCQYLEMKTLLAGYLLNSQGDRMLSAHGVEGRYPYLDHHVIEFLAHVPERFKLNGLKDKYILRRAYQGCLPQTLTDRPKFPYRAPEAQAFMGDDNGYVSEYFKTDAMEEVGIFEPGLCQKLLSRLKSKKGNHVNTRDNLAFIQILSTQALYHTLIKNVDRAGDDTHNDVRRVFFNNNQLKITSDLFSR